MLERPRTEESIKQNFGSNTGTSAAKLAVFFVLVFVGISPLQSQSTNQLLLFGIFTGYPAYLSADLGMSTILPEKSPYGPRLYGLLGLSKEVNDSRIRTTIGLDLQAEGIAAMRAGVGIGNSLETFRLDKTTFVAEASLRILLVIVKVSTELPNGLEGPNIFDLVRVNIGLGLF